MELNHAMGFRRFTFADTLTEVIMLARARINAARPLMLQRMLDTAASSEVWKGGLSAPAPTLVALEPAYRPLRSTSDISATEGPASEPWGAEALASPDQRCRLRIHLAPQQDTRWELADAFLRQLAGVRHRVSFELGGNVVSLNLWLTCEPEDYPILATAFESTYDQCRLQRVGEDPWSHWSPETWSQTCFLELGGAAAYSKALTSPPDVLVSPLATVLTALASFPKDAWGSYQILFQPVDRTHNWHGNMAVLYDYECLYRSTDGAHPALKGYQPIPSGDEKFLAEDLRKKAKLACPMFAAAARLYVVGEPALAQDMLRALETFTGLVQHGGRPLARGTIHDYQPVAQKEAARHLLAGHTFRPGFVCNSEELSAFVHLPPTHFIRRTRVPLAVMQTWAPGEDLRNGSAIAQCNYAGVDIPVCIPEEYRSYSQHVIGRPGTGKSVFVENQCLDNIHRGDGCAVFDPHGDLVQGILERLTPADIDRVILLDWTNPDWVPVFNPFASISKVHRGRVADDFVSSMRTFIDGFGHRLEHLLRCSLHGLLHLPEPCLLDVADALSTKSAESQLLRSEVLKVVEDPILVRFWKQQLDTYSNADLSPPQNKLSMILGTPPVAYTFQQHHSKFSLRQIMDERKILLVNLAGIGSEIQSTLGCLLLSLFQTEALARAKVAHSDRRLFHIYVDEAHRFTTRSIEAMLAQCRKYRVSLTLAHQYLSQFSPEQIDALSSVGTTIVFNVDRRDAQYLSKDLQDKVEIEQILTLGRGEAIARIGTEVVRIKTSDHRPLTSPSCVDAILSRCHQLYYAPVEVVKRSIATRHNRWDSIHAQSPAGQRNPGKESPYDTF